MRVWPFVADFHVREIFFARGDADIGDGSCAAMGERATLPFLPFFRFLRQCDEAPTQAASCLSFSRRHGMGNAVFAVFCCDLAVIHRYGSG